MMFKISIGKLNDLYAAISASRQLYLPVKSGDRPAFGLYNDKTEADLNSLNTVKSAKDLFFPQTEDMMSFKIDGKTITVKEQNALKDEFVIFGVRACDAAGFEVLDKVFLSEPVDTYYSGRRKLGIVCTLACNKPEETCFCSNFGTDCRKPGGDVETFICGDYLYWKPVTDKGSKLTEAVSSVLAKAEDAPAELENQNKEVRAIIEKLPFAKLKLDKFNGANMNELFKAPEWAELSQSCIGCGTCTFVCPTCQCYDIRDYDTGHGVQRSRCWDSCMYSDFTKMSAGNPRLTQLERFRQRFMHKLVYFPSNNDGMYGCVGCGRCLAKCPVSMNIVKVIKTLGGDCNE